MSLHKEKKEKFKAVLDESHQWPSKYPFKFIIIPEQIEELKSVLEHDNFDIKASKKGKYVSISFELEITSSDEVINIYEKVSIIKGIIAL